MRDTVERVLPSFPDLFTTALGSSASLVGALALARENAHHLLVERAVALGRR